MINGRLDLQSTGSFSGIILSAGLGTRMRPLTYERPKPLIPLWGRPIIEWSLNALHAVGIEHIGINTFHLGEQLPIALAHRSENIIWSHETVLQGTGGGVRDLSRRLPNKNIVVLNGDAIFDFSLMPLIDDHVRSGAIGTLALKEVPPDDPFGRVGVDRDGYIVRISEVQGPRAMDEVRVGAFTGVQVVTEAICRALPEGECDIFRTAHRALLNHDTPIKAHFVPSDSLWVDVGTPGRAIAAHHALWSAPNSILWNQLPAHTRVGVNGAVLFGDAEVTRPELLSHCWVGAGTRLTNESAQSNVIIWDGVNASLVKSSSRHDCIVTNARECGEIWGQKFRVYCAQSS